MRISVNRNNLWTDLVVKTLSKWGVRYAVISPGSRSTPITLSFAKNKKIKKFVFIDERTGGFFALGLAKKSNAPVAVVTTSGTALGELYPAVIEAYNSRIPLVICTADRPPELRNTGANQTINQENFYSNHIRRFQDTGLPGVEKSRLIKMIAQTSKLLETGVYRDKGPVHLNLPFDKPLEPFSTTDKIDPDLIGSLEDRIDRIKLLSLYPPPASAQIKSLTRRLINSKKGLFIVGWDDYTKNFHEELHKLSAKLRFPILSDGTTDSRFTGNFSGNLINFPASITGSNLNKEKFSPDMIFQFGAPPTSNSLLKFIKDADAEKILINRFGDIKDPSGTYSKIVKAEPEAICRVLNNDPKIRAVNLRKEWISSWTSADSAVGKTKKKMIQQSNFPFEGGIINDIISFIPFKSQIFVSNSLLIRDFDSYSVAQNKNLKIFVNRGASGIDGNISTAAGISAISKGRTLLLTGDLAFFHDMNGLWSLRENRIPLIIVLVDNNGGSIFEMLPVFKEKKYFIKYFKTPHNLDFAAFIAGYKGNYFKPESRKAFRKNLITALNRPDFSVIHIVSDSRKSIQTRSEIQNAVDRKLSDFSELNAVRS